MHARDRLARAELRVHATLVAMTQRRRKCVRRIRGRGTVELQDGYNHVLDLFFGRCPRSDHGLLDFPRRVLEHVDVVFECRAQGRRARMTEFQRTAGVLVHEDALDGDDVRLKLGHDATHGFKNLPQSIGKRTVHAFYRAARHVGRRVAQKIEDTETGQARAWIDPEYASLVSQKRLKSVPVRLH